MRYFTPELWLALGTTEPRAVLLARRKVDRAVAAYQRNLQELAPRLDAASRRFFRATSLHDGTLLSLSFEPYSPASRRSGALVTCRVLSATESSVFRLSYSKVTRFQVSHPGSKSVYDEDDGGIGSWGYDELTYVKRGLWRHEVLFSTGATIVVEYARFASAKERWRSLRKQPSIK
jgi:hypothetical protein